MTRRLTAGDAPPLRPDRNEGQGLPPLERPTARRSSSLDGGRAALPPRPPLERTGSLDRDVRINAAATAGLAQGPEAGRGNRPEFCSPVEVDSGLTQDRLNHIREVSQQLADWFEELDDVQAAEVSGVTPHVAYSGSGHADELTVTFAADAQRDPIAAWKETFPGVANHLDQVVRKNGLDAREQARLGFGFLVDKGPNQVIVELAGRAETSKGKKIDIGTISGRGYTTHGFLPPPRFEYDQGGAPGYDFPRIQGRKFPDNTVFQTFGRLGMPITDKGIANAIEKGKYNTSESPLHEREGAIAESFRKPMAHGPINFNLLGDRKLSDQGSYGLPHDVAKSLSEVMHDGSVNPTGHTLAGERVMDHSACMSIPDWSGTAAIPRGWRFAPFNNREPGAIASVYSNGGRGNSPLPLITEGPAAQITERSTKDLFQLLHVSVDLLSHNALAVHGPHPFDKGDGKPSLDREMDSALSTWNRAMQDLQNPQLGQALSQEAWQDTWRPKFAELRSRIEGLINVLDNTQEHRAKRPGAGFPLAAVPEQIGGPATPR